MLHMLAIPALLPASSTLPKQARKIAPEANIQQSSQSLCWRISVA
jgi:hypothetical protein